MQRNHIAMHYPCRAKAALVRWREIDGLTPGEIRARAASEWPDLPRIHASTWLAWSRSQEYRELRGAVLEERGRNARLDRMWTAVRDGAADDVAAATLYLLLHRAYELAETGRADVRELRNLVSAVSEARRAEIARVKAETDRTLRELRGKHAGEIAEKDAEIARLRSVLEAAGIDPDAEKAGGKRITDEDLEKIRQRVGLG